MQCRRPEDERSIAEHPGDSGWAAASPRLQSLVIGIGPPLNRPTQAAFEKPRDWGEEPPSVLLPRE